MVNPGQPTVSLGATGKAVRRLQRALRRTPNPSLTVDGTFGSQLEAAVKVFQEGAGLTADGIVGPLTWAALPDGRPMPLLREGSSGDVVRELQRVLTNGASEWGASPQGIDGQFGPHTKLLSRRSKPGAALPPTELSVTRLGQCPCTLQVRLWKRQLGSGSWSIERWTRFMEPAR
jgi:peptidoglycan hydrolase-like protein with peptidoglycan-binding domain